jgi:hypothetical protein
MMSSATRRAILRWIHIILSIPIMGYIYSPFANLPQYAGPTRFVFFPAIVITGLWMWRGQALRRFFCTKTA